MVRIGSEGVPAPWPALFAPQERLGWTYTDRQQLRRPFDEPEPDVDASEPEISVRDKAVAERLPIRLFWAWKAAVVGAVVGLAALVRRTDRAGSAFTPSQVAVAAGVGAAIAATGWILLVLAHLQVVRSLAARGRARRLSRSIAVADSWSQRLAAHEDREVARLAAVPQWQPVALAPGVRRIDVVGGTLWGWEAFLTVVGSGTLTARGAVLVLDLSAEVVVGELARGAADTGLAVDLQVLPDGLADCDLLTGMSHRDIVDAFVESLHGGDAQTGRADRATDSRILTEICNVLADGGLTMARIAAAARVLLGEPGRPDELTGTERSTLADEVFSQDYRTQSSATLRRIEALAHPLGPLGSRREPRPQADLRCMATTSSWRSGSADFLADLIVAWAAGQAAGPAAPATIVVAGADELAVRHIERLSDLCDRRGVRLVLMFRHLRETSARVLGAGPVAFMRLGNHDEAAHAADYIGRQHRFVVSGLTHSVGGDQSHASADSTGASHGTGQTQTRDRGATAGGLLGAVTHNWGRSDSTSRNTERNWGHTATVAESAHWSDSTDTQRVYEHAVEPRALQQLPDYAMLLVEHTPSGTAVRSVEINPEIPLLDQTQPAPPPGPSVPGFPASSVSSQNRSPLGRRDPDIELDHEDAGESDAAARREHRNDRRSR